MSPIKKLAGPALAFACILGAPSACADDTPPTATAGLAAKLLGEMPLGPEFQATGDRRFRMRLLTVDKGGTMAPHGHGQRPSLEYILSGTAIEYRDGQTKTYTAGDVVIADHTVVHAWRNGGDGPVTVLAVDIYAPE